MAGLECFALMLASSGLSVFGSKRYCPDEVVLVGLRSRTIFLSRLVLPLYEPRKQSPSFDSVLPIRPGETLRAETLT